MPATLLKRRVNCGCDIFASFAASSSVMRSRNDAEVIEQSLQPQRALLLADEFPLPNFGSANCARGGKEFRAGSLAASFAKLPVVAREVAFQHAPEHIAHAERERVAGAQRCAGAGRPLSKRQQEGVVVRRRAEAIDELGQKLMTMTRVSKLGKSST
jgi:hypothetical protein